MSALMTYLCAQKLGKSRFSAGCFDMFEFWQAYQYATTLWEDHKSNTNGRHISASIFDMCGFERME
jgi:hypothetical protein